MCPFSSIIHSHELLACPQTGLICMHAALTHTHHCVLAAIMHSFGYPCVAHFETHRRAALLHQHPSLACELGLLTTPGHSITASCHSVAYTRLTLPPT